MLVDLAPVASSVTDFVTSLGLPEINSSALLRLITSAIVALLAFLIIRMVWRMFDAKQKTNILREGFSNWRLSLLGATGVILSLASGWTTWDGMRNFTQEPLLSLMITFGIQGVMLIVAWLIGESFAVGMNNHQPGGANVQKLQTRPLIELPPWLPKAIGLTVGFVVGVIVFGALAILVLDAFSVNDVATARANSLIGWSNNFVIGVTLVVVAAGVLFAAGGQVWGDYVQAIKIMVRSAVLWVMFLACMATSVFFSFDSLFATIFSKEERARAAELRAQNQIAGVVADIGTISTRRRIVEIERLFQSPAWASYDAQLDAVIDIANGAPGAIRRQIAAELEAQSRRVAELEEKRASAQSGQASLAARKVRLTEELGRVKTERPEAAAFVAEFKGVVAGVEKRADEARAKMLAEERGVEGSGRAGRGPFWRAARTELRKVQAELEVANRRLTGHRERLDRIDRQASTITAELAEIDGELAKLQGSAQTAEQLIAVARTSSTSEASQRLDPAAGVGSLEKARQAFRQEPTAQGLAELQGLCLSLQNAGQRVQSLTARASAIDCDPGVASESAARVFALNVGIGALQANCIGGNKLPETGGPDALFGFARRCVQDSGLPSDATSALRQRINSIELNRDDKAHRFVVTTNAFNDGNTLAYLALAIAIAIDSLVFMSGLFGANALQTPLGRMGSNRALSAQEMVKVIDNTLLPDKYGNATTALRHILPLKRKRQGDEHDDWTHQVMLRQVPPSEAGAVLSVLNGGQTIDAVRHDPMDPNHYLLRRQLVQHLNIVASTSFEKEHIATKQSELKSLLGTVLQPQPQHGASLVIANLRPVSTERDFSNEIQIDRIADPIAKDIAVRALNAGSTLNTPEMVIVAEDTSRGDAYLTHSLFFKTLAMIAAEAPHVVPGQITGAGAAAYASVGDIGSGAGSLDSGRLPPEGLAQSAPRAGVGGAAAAFAGATVAAASGEGADRSGPLNPDQRDDDNSELAARIEAEFLTGLNITERQRNWVDQNLGQANAAETLLNRLMGQDHQIAQSVRDEWNLHSETLSRVANSIETQAGQDAVIVRLTREHESLFGELLPLLMLAPDGAYQRILDTVHDRLEQANSGMGANPEGLDADAAEQLRRLSEHRRALSGASSSQDTFASVAAYIDAAQNDNPDADASDDSNIKPFPIGQTLNAVNE